MIIGPIPRLILYVLAGIFPIWSEFVATSSDYSLRGLLRPILASGSVAVVVMLARTRNPLVDGDREKAIERMDEAFKDKPPTQ